MKKVIIALIFICIITSVIFFTIDNRQNNINDEVKESEKMIEEKVKLSVNGKELTIDLENNSSSKAFIEKLKESDIEIQAHDYGNFEKVGDLGFSLPTNDQNITTEAGDVILYQGNQITVYYDTNTWNFTRLGKINGISQNELKNILGSKDVVLKFSLIK